MRRVPSFRLGALDLHTAGTGVKAFRKNGKPGVNKTPLRILLDSSADEVGQWLIAAAIPVSRHKKENARPFPRGEDFR